MIQLFCYFYDVALTVSDIKTNAGKFPGALEVQGMFKATLDVFWCEWEEVGVEAAFSEHQLCAPSAALSTLPLSTSLTSAAWDAQKIKFLFLKEHRPVTHHVGALNFVHVVFIFSNRAHPLRGLARGTWELWAAFHGWTW